MPRPNLHRIVRVNLRLTHREMGQLRRAAKQAGEPVTTFARRAAVMASTKAGGGRTHARP